jgi:hypothetical protein
MRCAPSGVVGGRMSHLCLDGLGLCGGARGVAGLCQVGERLAQRGHRLLIVAVLVNLHLESKGGRGVRVGRIATWVGSGERGDGRGAVGIGGGWGRGGWG